MNLVVEKGPAKPADVVLEAKDICVRSKHTGKNVVDHVSFQVRRGEIVCVAGIDGNGQTELVYALTGLHEPDSGHVLLKGQDVTHAHIRTRNTSGLGHIPEDRHRHGLVLDYNLAYNLVLQSYFEPRFCQHGFLKYDAIYQYADELIGKFDIRSGQGARTIARSMSGGNQQKAIVAREIDRNPDVLIAVQPTRGLDVGAIEYIHKQIVAERDAGKGILLVSLELDEVMQLSDRILVIYEGQIVADLDPKAITVQELGLYMAGSKRGAGKMNKKQKTPLTQKQGFVSFMGSVLAILCGLVVGFLVLLLSDPANAVNGFISILTGAFSDMKNLGAGVLFRYSHHPHRPFGGLCQQNGPVQYRRPGAVRGGGLCGGFNRREMYVHSRAAAVDYLPCGRHAGRGAVGFCAGLFESRVQCK